MSGDNLSDHNCLAEEYSGSRCVLLLPADIDECGTGRHSCANDTICFNLDGGYDCRCPHGKNCTGDCVHEGKVKHNGQIWVLENDRCSVCSCQVGADTVLCSGWNCPTFESVDGRVLTDACYHLTKTVTTTEHFHYPKCCPSPS